MNEGMGVPRTPLARRVATSTGALPPRKRQGFVRLAGAIGLPQSSFSSGRDGPSERPSVPWHLLHSIASYISLPRRIDSGEEATSFGSSSFFGASLNVSGAKVLRCATRFQRSFLGSTAPDGIEVRGLPSAKRLKRSRSVGVLFVVLRMMKA